MSKANNMGTSHVLRYALRHAREGPWSRAVQSMSLEMLPEVM